MDPPNKNKIPPRLVLTAVLSGGLTIGLSLAYIVLSVLALLFRYSCTAGSLATATGNHYFWTTIYNVYIQAEDCMNSVTVLNITSEHTVFVFAITTLCISALCLVTAIALISTIQDEQSARYLNLVVIAYIGSCIISLAVDITTATHFGLDYGYLSTVLASSLPGSSANYKTEVIRQGAFLLMGIALKGYVAHVINMVLLILLAVYSFEHKNNLTSDEHSIHKLGALNAFDQQKKQEDNWSQPEPFSQLGRRTQVNSSYVQDEEPPRTPIRGPLREPSRSDYFSKTPGPTSGSTSFYDDSCDDNNSRSFDRSDSWQQGQPSLAHNSRPFSYLEDIKRPVPTKPPASPAIDAPWNRDSWANPPVPVPDYSPPPARRLKSALKPAYM